MSIWQVEAGYGRPQGSNSNNSNSGSNNTSGSGNTNTGANGTNPTATTTLANPRFVYNQAVPATTWNITHNLNCYPTIVVVDSAGNSQEGAEYYVDLNNIVLTFSYQFGGTASLF